MIKNVNTLPRKPLKTIIVIKTIIPVVVGNDKKNDGASGIIVVEQSLSRVAIGSNFDLKCIISHNSLCS